MKVTSIYYDEINQEVFITFMNELGREKLKLMLSADEVMELVSRLQKLILILKKRKKKN